MKFDNLLHYDLVTGLHRFIPFLLILLFDIDRIHYNA